MPFCPRCGIEVDAEVETCPLCGTEIPELEEPEWKYPYYPEYPEKPLVPPITARERGIIAWEVIGVTFAAISLLLLMLNLIINHTVSWSLYPVSSLITALLLITFPIFWPRKPVVIVAGYVITVMIFLLVIDAINGQIDWFYQLALPIMFIVLVVTAVLVFLSSKFNKPLSITGFVLIGISIICLGVDIYTHEIVEGYFAATWSLVVLPPLIVIGLFLIYIQYRISKKVDIKKRTFI